MKAARFVGLMTLYIAQSTFCSAQALIPTPAGPISVEAIQQDFDAQKYSDVIRKTTAALLYKGPSAAQLDRAGLFALKAEAYLRIKQFIPAADTFALAAKEAADEKDIALDQSTALLIHRSVMGQYTPKSAPAGQPAVVGRAPKPPPIGIVDPDSRKLAMSALFDDELKATTPKIQAATKQTALPPLMNAVNDVHELSLLELTATGADASSAQLYSSLENRAGQLMGDAVKTMAQRVEQISKSASGGTTHYEESPYGGRRTVTTKNGLNSNDTATLNEVIDTSKKIVAACEEFAKSLPSTTATGDGALARVDADASKLSGRADEILHANYDQEVTDTPAGIMTLPPQVAPQLPPGSRVVPPSKAGGR